VISALRGQRVNQLHQCAVVGIIEIGYSRRKLEIISQFTLNGGLFERSGKRRVILRATETSMKITQLRLGNFKIFKKAHFDLAPLTLLTGTNSSGKSTILNAITGVLQSQSPHSYPFEFVPNGKNCLLGSYRDIAHRKTTRTNFSVGLSLQQGTTRIDVDGQYRYSSSGDQILPDKIDYKKNEDELHLIWRGQDVGYRAIAHGKTPMESLDDEMREALKAFMDSVIRTAQKKALKTKLSVDDVFKRHLAKWFSLKGRNARDIANEIKQDRVGARLLSELRTHLDQLTRSVAYIGPVRAYPARYYSTAEGEQVIDPAGKNTIPFLYEWKKYSPKKYKEVVRNIQSLELASMVDTKSNLDEILKVSVRPYRHSERVNLADVGFGVSQALPILVADVALPKDGTLLVNQPEVHLHPSSQARLGDLFSSRLKTRRYLLETHSEYLINRLRLLAVEGQLDVNDVSILFFDVQRRLRQPKIHVIGIAKDGSLINAPKSFFDTYYLDTFDIAMGGFSDGK
jgi:predicted ATPase